MAHDAILSERGATKAYNHVNDFRRCPSCNRGLFISVYLRDYIVCPRCEHTWDWESHGGK